MNIEVGVLGGSGFYKLLGKSRQVKASTPYGHPSGEVVIGTHGGKQVAFLPRHGERHHLPPHLIPYKANLYAFKYLGVTRVIAPTACGSLQPEVKPGDFVVCDQFVDRTRGRDDSYFQGPKSKPRFSPARVVHIATTEPYCPQLRQIAITTAKKLGMAVHPTGTVVVINGPRFSTRAESQWFSRQGWQVVNMTQYPEVVLAKELGMCYVNISLITDYDAGLAGRKDIPPVSVDRVLEVLQDNNDRVKRLVLTMIAALPSRMTCRCRHSIDSATIG